jgi:peptidoglycan/xylan/chitin deacetylase (PgdA/CDA1 family)
MNFQYEPQPHGIMFHHFHDENHPVGQGSISAAQFSTIISRLGRNRILSCEEWMSRALGGTLRKGDLCFTFDDNLRCQFDIAFPIMKALGITAFWFVYNSVLQGALERLEIYRYFRNTQFASINDFYHCFFEHLAGRADNSCEYRDEVEAALADFVPADYLKDFVFYTDDDRKFRFLRDQVLGVERYNRIMDRMIELAGFDASQLVDALWMDDECIRELKINGHIIGLHSYSHPTNIASMDRSEQEREYRTNYDYLSTLLGAKPLTMSHPCNSYNADTLEILSKLGIQLGFRANMVATPGAGVLEMPRQDHSNVLKVLASGDQ